MRQIKYVAIEGDTFKLYDKPQRDTTPFIFASTDDGIFVDEAFLLDSERCRIAAGLAISNMGQEVPERIYESSEDQRWETTARSEVESLAGHLMETDEHDEIFVGEAEMWYENIKDLSLNEILRQFQHNSWVEKIILAE